jgi:hypothetical protein
MPWEAALAVIGEAQDDGVVHQPGLFERVEHRRDVLIHDGVKISVKVDVLLRALARLSGGLACWASAPTSGFSAVRSSA